MYTSAQHIDPLFVLGKTSPPLVGSMQEEVYEAYERMRQAAAKEGIDIKVVSAHRSYHRQREIWNAKYKTLTLQGLPAKDAIQEIITYSTLPGTSRHHWGTDIDIIDNANPQSGDVLLAEKFYGDGPSSALRSWMNRNAADYGFLEVYTDHPNRKGFAHEPWHYTYHSLSKAYLEVLTNQVISEIAKDEQLLGRKFLDADFFKSYTTEHLLDINPILFD
ncbi:MAG: M15 family metallopeptidase [Flavobacteriaceae bacterium]|nr:D-alanyl-D-alanine carboxypeptidase [Flavobacteriaceae bacterium]